jgi:prolyl-tRNA editing enzyme YbaK/EbsC (Cys-tRNA(Pro) deacylase)
MHSSTAAFVDEARDRYGFEVDVHEFEAGTKTAADAADQIGCDVAQIASSIAVDAAGELVVVVTSGANRVDFERVAALRDAPTEDVGMADADDVKDTLGWSIGGVPPFCHETAVPVYVDETLLGFDEVWAAAGTPQAVFPIDPDTLVDLSEGTVESVAS